MKFLILLAVFGYVSTEHLNGQAPDPITLGAYKRINPIRFSTSRAYLQFQFTPSQEQRLREVYKRLPSILAIPELQTDALNQYILEVNSILTASQQLQLANMIEEDGKTISSLQRPKLYPEQEQKVKASYMRFEETKKRIVEDKLMTAADKDKKISEAKAIMREEMDKVAALAATSAPVFTLPASIPDSTPFATPLGLPISISGTELFVISEDDEVPDNGALGSRRLKITVANSASTPAQVSGLVENSQSSILSTINGTISVTVPASSSIVIPVDFALVNSEIRGIYTGKFTITLAGPHNQVVGEVDWRMQAP